MCGGRNATCTPPPTPPPQDNNPQAVGAGLSAGRLRAAPLGCPPSAPAASQRAIKVDPEHSWGGGRGRRGGGPRLAAPQLRVFFSPPLAPHTFPPPRLLLSARCFYFQSSAEGPESGEDAAAAPGAAPLAAGSGTARCAAAERSGESARSRRSQGEAARIHSVRPALRLAPSLALFKQYLPCWWFGFLLLLLLLLF